jgi:PAS domain S-box-containing protein
MKLDSLSNKQLDQSLRTLQQTADTAGEVDRLQQTVQALQVHQIELEMHNRSLREMQSELEASIHRYSDLYDNLPIPYLTVSPAGLIIAANRAAGEWLGDDPRGLVGTYLRKFLAPYDAGRVSAHLEDCVNATVATTMEVTLRPGKRDPVSVQISSRSAHRGESSEPQILVAITDISKLKQTQKVLEEINREQEAFNYSISHDLRAPLITINNYAGIVLSDHAAQLDEAGRGMLQRIQAAAFRMETTLKNLLQYSTLSREEIVLESVDVDGVVSDLLIEHRGIIQERKAEVSVEKPLPRVRGSTVILNQVMTNLLTNALKYTEPGQSPRVRIFAEKRGEQVILKVSDEGIGIEPKYHERIFQIFERLHGYSRYPGSGVGLAIVRRAVSRMNGRIWVESAPGKGSCFSVELPPG